MKKLISLVIAVALVVCLLPVMASAEVATGIGLLAEDTNYVGENVWLQPEYLGGDEWPADLVWTSSDPAIVEVSGSNWGCDCTLLAAGTATVTVTSGSLSAFCEITAVTPPALTLDTPLEVTTEGYETSKATFTAAEAGTYTVYIPTTEGRVSGDVNTSMGYGSLASDTTGILATAAVELAAGETATIYTYAYEETAVNYELLVIKTPVRTGLKPSLESIELSHMAGSPDYTQVELLPDPITAAAPMDITWKMVDENVAIIPYTFGNYCYIESVAVGGTVLEAYDANLTLLASIPVVVKDAMADAQEIVWGVEYDVTGSALFTFTPAVTDTYTFQSFGDTTNSDPVIAILVAEGDGYSFQYGFHDYDGLNFYGEAQLTAGTEYILKVDNYNSEDSAFSFSVKGTAASDPGYDLKKVAAKPADCTTDGNIEYYLCQKTGIKFANETATKLAGEVVIKATGHKLDKVAEVAATAEKEGTKAHEKCSVCGALVLNGKEVKAADLVIAKLDNPPTGDSTLLIPFVALVVLSTLGLGITAVARKRA